MDSSYSHFSFFACQGCTHERNSISKVKLGNITNNPKFDWFKYKGNDPIYRNLSVGENEYINPILAGFYPDPSIVRVGEDYYMVNSSFAYFPGIPIFHSKNMVDWHQIGHVLERSSQLHLDGLNISEGVFAPTISYHNGTFYVLNTLVGGGGNYMVTTTNPAGTWSDPIWLDNVGGIDPSLFFDDDGTAYILNCGVPEGGSRYPGQRAIWIRKYDIKNHRIIGKPKIVINGGTGKHPVWIEGPHMMKVNGMYYIYAAQGGTGSRHSEVVYRSDHPMGPYTPYKNNPILTQRNISQNRVFNVEYTGHADIVKTQNGEWWSVFLGVRTYDSVHFNTGRETFLLPVTWKNGWPIILAPGDTVPVKLNRPNLPQGKEPNPPTHGNFTHIDDFNESALADYWIKIRTPHEKWWNISKDGFLQIAARPEIISGSGNPSFIGRRQQHLYGFASTKMIYKPEAPGDTAGLVAFQGSHYYFLLGVTINKQGKKEVFVKKSEGNQTNIIASEVLKGDSDNEYYLKIRFKGADYDFYYALSPNSWQSLYQDADGTVLSTNVAGGFVGTVIGMYAYTPE